MEGHKKGGLQQTLKGRQATEDEESTSVPARDGSKKGTMQAASSQGSVQREGVTITPSTRSG